jgi:hypothetical protein
MRTILAAVVTAAMLALQCGCASRGDGGAPGDTISDPVVADVLSPAAMAGAETGPILDPSSLTQTELQFGRAPKPDPNVTYQPGVIVMEHGDTAISSMESNGIVWHFKAGAPQVDQIQEDTIIFATERCMGRVLHVDRNGDDVRVVLGPVQLTDLFAKAHLAVDQPIDLTKAVAIAAPDFPNPTPEPSGSPSAEPSVAPSPGASPTNTGYAPRARLVSMTYSLVSPDGMWRPFRAVRYDARGDPRQAIFEPTARRVPVEVAQALAPDAIPKGVPAPMPGKAIPTVDINSGLDATPCLFKCGGLGLQMTYDQGGVKISAYAVLYLQNPRAKVNLDIDRGVKAAGIRLTGVAGFKAHYELGADQSFVRNVHLKGDIPLDLSFLVNMLTPASVHFTQSLILSTGFSARTSVIEGTFDYSVCCSIGVGYNGTGYGADAPMKFSAKNQVAHDVNGVSVGINSALLSLRQQVMFGIGFLGFAAGPYVGLVASTTILKQSSTAALVLPGGGDCRQGTFELALDGGVGWTIPKLVTSVVNFFLSVFHAKPIPSNGSFIQIPQQVLIGERHEMPPKCAGG